MRGDRALRPPCREPEPARPCACRPRAGVSGAQASSVPTAPGVFGARGPVPQALPRRRSQRPDRRGGSCSDARLCSPGSFALFIIFPPFLSVPVAGLPGVRGAAIALPGVPAAAATALGLHPARRDGDSSGTVSPPLLRLVPGVPARGGAGSPGVRQAVSSRGPRHGGAVPAEPSPRLRATSARCTRGGDDVTPTLPAGPPRRSHRPRTQLSPVAGGWLRV